MTFLNAPTRQYAGGMSSPVGLGVVGMEKSILRDTESDLGGILSRVCFVRVNVANGVLPLCTPPLDFRILGARTIREY